MNTKHYNALHSPRKSKYSWIAYTVRVPQHRSINVWYKKKQTHLYCLTTAYPWSFLFDLSIHPSIFLMLNIICHICDLSFLAGLANVTFDRRDNSVFCLGIIWCIENSFWCILIHDKMTSFRKILWLVLLNSCCHPNLRQAQALFFFKITIDLPAGTTFT